MYFTATVYVLAISAKAIKIKVKVVVLLYSLEQIMNLKMIMIFTECLKKY